MKAKGNIAQLHFEHFWWQCEHIFSNRMLLSQHPRYVFEQLPHSGHPEGMIWNNLRGTFFCLSGQPSERKKLFVSMFKSILNIITFLTDKIKMCVKVFSNLGRSFLWKVGKTCGITIISHIFNNFFIWKINRGVPCTEQTPLIKAAFHSMCSIQCV